jgi:hypothetical protein
MDYSKSQFAACFGPAVYLERKGYENGVQASRGEFFSWVRQDPGGPHYLPTRGPDTGYTSASNSITILFQIIFELLSFLDDIPVVRKTELMNSATL